MVLAPTVELEQPLSDDILINLLVLTMSKVSIKWGYRKS